LSALQLAAAAANARPCEPPVLGESHPSLEHAATATLRALFRSGGIYESGGFVIEQAGKFRASKPVTQRSRSNVSYCIVVPRGATLAGLYHTHVGRAEFSPRDQRNSERAGVPSFIGTIRDGAVFVYDPQRDNVTALGDANVRPLQAQADAKNPPATWFSRLGAVLTGVMDLVRRTWNELTA
jgi:proteasome lid subunit RPN8/RPN11